MKNKYMLYIYIIIIINYFNKNFYLELIFYKKKLLNI